jgi:hypothetical protein
MSANVVFAGGAWTWNGMGVSYGKVFSSSNTAIESCKRHGVRHIYLTLWGDDGSEGNPFTALLAMQLYAEQAYAEELDLEKLKRRVRFCTGINFDAFTDLKYLDETPGTLPDNCEINTPANPSKFLLWQDALLGLFDYQVQGHDLASHYAQLEEKLRRHKENFPAWAMLFDVPEKLCAVLKMKSDLGLRIKSAYDGADRAMLAQIATAEIPEIIRQVRALRQAHRAQWFAINKPFGWEVLDIRYGGVLARLESTAERLDDFVNGTVEHIDELEEERLPFDGIARPQPNVSVGFCNQYMRIVTPGLFSLIWPPI